MPIQSPRNLWQTLLCFPTVSSDKKAAIEVEVEVEVQTTPRAGIKLPAEVWLNILPDLSTIALKIFRLVCKEWSRLGATWLFSTVHVDNCEDSWIRLQQLAVSQYACLTTTIVYTPLEISEACLDSSIWRQTYPNLTQGASHTKSLQLHKIYCKLYYENEEKKFIRPTARVNTEALRRTMACFSRCHTITIQDEIDVETSCDNPFLRKHIQCDSELVQKFSIWGRLPRWWSRDTASGHLNRLNVAALVLDLIDCSPYLHRLELCLWNPNLLKILEHFSFHREEPSTAAITDVYVRTKWCRALQSWLVHDMSLDTSTSTGSILKRFPKVRQMTIESHFVDSGPSFLNLYHQKLRQVEAPRTTHVDYDDDSQSVSSSSSSSSCSHYSTLSSLEAEYEPPQRLEKDFLLKLRTELHLDVWSQVPDLTLLTFHNVTLNTRALISWLCNQTQVPYVAITIEFTGTTVLYGLDQALLSKILRWINVRLVYDHEQTYCYGTELCDTERLVCHNNWAIGCSDSPSKYWWCEVNNGTQDSLEEIVTSPSCGQISKSPVQPHSQSTALPAVQFLHRPGVVRELIPAWGNDDEWGTSYFVYYVYPDSDVSFKWVHTTYYPRDQSRGRYALLIVKVTLDYKS